MDSLLDTLAIIPCTKAKIWDNLPHLGPVIAQNVYTNPFHSLARSYIQKRSNSWYIMSAKYGFLHPDDVIPETYDITFDRKNDPYISDEQLKFQMNEKNFSNFKNVIVICNERYVERIQRALSGLDINVEIPFRNIEDDEVGCKRLLNAIFERGDHHVI